MEYGILLALVSLVAMVVVKTSGSKAASAYDNIQSQLAAHGVASAAPQSPGVTATAAASNPTAAGNAAASVDSNDSGKQDRTKNDLSKHNNQNRNGNNGRNRS